MSYWPRDNRPIQARRRLHVAAIQATSPARCARSGHLAEWHRLEVPVVAPEDISKERRTAMWRDDMELRMVNEQHDAVLKKLMLDRQLREVEDHRRDPLIDRLYRVARLVGLL